MVESGGIEQLAAIQCGKKYSPVFMRLNKPLEEII
jgi:hypothetical protein